MFVRNDRWESTVYGYAYATTCFTRLDHRPHPRGKSFDNPLIPIVTGSHELSHLFFKSKNAYDPTHDYHHFSIANPDLSGVRPYVFDLYGV